MIQNHNAFTPHKHSFWTVVGRGCLGRCPQCGRGALFKGYLKQVSDCAVCYEPLAHFRADDGPAWLTIIVAAHLLAPFLITLSLPPSWPDWAVTLTWSAAAIVLILMLLPRAKGVFIGLLWRIAMQEAASKYQRLSRTQP